MSHRELMLEAEIERLRQEIAYLRARQGPVHFLIDRGNYLEMLEIVGPINGQRLEEKLRNMHATAR